MARPRQLAVHHPKPGQEVLPCSCVVAGVPSYFILAQGMARGFSNLTAVLVDLDASRPYMPTISRPGIHWQFGFTPPAPPAPPMPPTPPTRYLLLVAQFKAEKGTHSACVAVEFSVTPPSRGNVPILFPLVDDCICPTFVAYGSLINGAQSATAGTMTLAPNPAIQGTPITAPAPPAGTWMYQFTGVAENIGYTFAVTDSLGANGSSLNITVDSSVCAPAPVTAPVSP
jgi:hypothetical protein